jgi:hypothetical protein
MPVRPTGDLTLFADVVGRRSRDAGDFQLVPVEVDGLAIGIMRITASKNSSMATDAISAQRRTAIQAL